MKRAAGRAATALRMRLGETADILPAKDFYLDRMRSADPDQRAALPIPSLLDIADAVEQRDFVLVENAQGEIVAVAGIFRILAHSTGDFFELSGMATHPSVGGLAPHSLQRILIAVRLARASQYFLDEARPGSVLASFVKRTNRRSSDNLTNAKLVLTKRLPDWLSGEYVSWFGWDRASDWYRFEASVDALRWAAQVLLETRRSGNHFALSRVDRQSGEEEFFSLTIDSRVLDAVVDTLETLADEVTSIQMPSLPETIAFR